MENEIALSLLAIVVITSGCTSITGGGGDEPRGSVTVTSAEVRPSSIYSGSSVRISLEAKNTGSVKANLKTGQDGEKVLKDYCPYLFENSRYSSIPKKIEEQNETTVLPDQEISLSWRLDQQGRVPLIGSSCDISLELPFEYSVSAYKQIQLKKSRDIEGSKNLRWESSSGPLKISMATIGGTGESSHSSFIMPEEDGSKIATVLIRLENPHHSGRGGITDINETSLRIHSEMLKINETFRKSTSCEGELTKGYSGNLKYSQGGSDCVTQDASYRWVSAPGYGDVNCNLKRPEPIRMTDGQSRVIRCQVDLSNIKNRMSGPADIAEVSANVEYTYIKEAGSTKIEVKSRG